MQRVPDLRADIGRIDIGDLATGKLRPKAEPTDFAEFIDRSELAGVYATRQSMLGLGMWGLLGIATSISGFEESQEPLPPEYEKKREELREVEAELQQLRETEQRQMVTMMRDMFEPWGVTAMSVTVEADGFDLRMGQFIDAQSWAAMAAVIIEKGVAAAVADEARDKEREALWQRESQLRDELAQVGGIPDSNY